MKDLFSSYAGAYRAFRPTYPASLFAHVASLAPAHSAAWDVGCGNGQASVSLAQQFDIVYATDMSAMQIQNATAHPRVRYSQAPADKSGLRTNSINLTIVAQAFHWFNQEAFVKEVERVSTSSAVLCIWCYGLCQISDEIDAIVNSLYYDIVGPYWEPERKMIDDDYASVRMPFAEIMMPQFMMTAEWSIEHLLGYLHTWSAAHSYNRINNEDPIALVAEKLRLVFGDQATRTVRWRLSPRAWRLPAV